MLENNIPIADSAIAVIPGEYFRWRARVQFMESFQTRADAVSYAFQYGCNLIVERHGDDGPLFDVLQDPDRACTSGLNLELVETKDFLVEPETVGWTSLMFSSIYDLSRRTAAALTRIYNRQVAPSVHSAALRCWRSNTTLALRRAWGRHSQGKAYNLYQRIAAALASLYSREIAPRLRRAWNLSWSTTGHLAQRFATFVRTLYLREVGPRLRRAAIWYRQADFEGNFRRAWNRSCSMARDLARRLTASARTLYTREIAPLIRQASSRHHGSHRQGAFRRAR